MRSVKTVFAFILTFCLLLSFGTAAFADGEEPKADPSAGAVSATVITEPVYIEANNDSGNPVLTVEVGGNPATDPPVSVTPASGDTPSIVTIDAGISTTAGSSSSNLDVSTYNNANVEVTVQGGISSTGDFTGAIEAYTSGDGGNAKLTVQGDVSTTGKSSLCVEIGRG